MNDHIITKNGQYLTRHFKWSGDPEFAWHLPKEKAEVLAKDYGATVAQV